MLSVVVKGVCWLLALQVCCSPLRAEAREKDEAVRIAGDMEVVRLSERAYMHVSRHEVPPFGLVSANGLILVDKGEALLLDTPWTVEQTDVLLDWIEKMLRARVTAFVPNHWHKDSMGGLAAVQRRGIPSYAHEETIAIAAQKGLPQPEHGFSDTLTLKLHELEAHCAYLGGGHSTDGIFIWIPAERLLFPSCMVKDSEAENLGNTEDADVRAWSATMDKALAAFPEARIIVPGHGRPGGPELLRYTRRLAVGAAEAR